MKTHSAFQITLSEGLRSTTRLRDFELTRDISRRDWLDGILFAVIFLAFIAIAFAI